MATNRQSMSVLMYPGLAIIVKDKASIVTQYEQFYTMKGSKKAFEVMQSIAGFGLVSEKFEGEEASYDDPILGWERLFIHSTFAMKFRVTEEAIEDDQYGEVGNKMASNLGVSMRATREVQGAGIFNNGFTDSTNSPDGLPLFAAAHPLLGGGYYGNAPTIPAALSTTSLQAALTSFRRVPNERGFLTAIKPAQLVVPPELEFTANNILTASGQPGTPNNDVNTVKGRLTPNVYDYLTNPLAWFVLADKDDHGLVWYTRRSDRFRDYTDNSTDDAVFGGSYRCSNGWTGWRGVYGNPGA